MKETTNENDSAIGNDLQVSQGVFIQAMCFNWCTSLLRVILGKGSSKHDTLFYIIVKEHRISNMQLLEQLLIEKENNPF